MTSNNLIQCIKNNPLEYRQTLTIPQNTNFGFEIELENINSKILNKILKNYIPTWNIKEDKSLNPNNSAELVSPVMKNTKDTWIMLKKIAEILQRQNITFNNCSFQINYDDNLLPTDKDKIKFLKLFMMYEDIIYRYSIGESKDYRESIEMYAYPISLELKAYSEDYLIEKYTNQKRSGICFKNNSKKLIEIRTPNSTINPILWQNYVTFFYYLIEYSKSTKCSLNELNKYIEDFLLIDLLDNYKKEKTNKALKLCNNIFNNVKDKSYFMEQYLLTL